MASQPQNASAGLDLAPSSRKSSLVWDANEMKFSTDNDNLSTYSEFNSTAVLSVIGVQEDSPLEWSPNGKSFVYVSNDYSLIWVDVDIETASQKIQQVLKGHRESVSALLCHPTDPVMVSGGKDAMIVWDMQAGKMIARVLTNARGMHTAQVNCMGWICDGKALVTCSEDSFIMIWDVDAGYKKVDHYSGHKSEILACSVHEENAMMATSGRDSVIKLWGFSLFNKSFSVGKHMSTPNLLALLFELDGHRGDVVSLQFTTDGQTLVSGARDNTMKFYNMKAKTCTHTIRGYLGHRGDITQIVFLPPDDRVMLSSGADAKIMVWLLPEAEVEKKQEAVGDDDLFGGDDDFDLDMLEHDIDTANLPVRKDKRVYLRQAHRNAVSAMSVQPVESAFGKDGFLLVSSSPEHCVKVWHVQLRPVGEMDDVYAGKVQQQGDLCRMKMRHEFSGHPSAVSKLILLSDQCTSLSSSFDSIYLHHISRGKSGAVDDISVQVSFRYDGNIQDMDLTQDEKLLFVVGSDYVVYGYRIGLPTDWLEAKDKQGRVFYRHKDHDPQDDKRKAWFSWTHPYLLNSDPFRSCEEAMRTGADHFKKSGETVFSGTVTLTGHTAHLTSVAVSGSNFPIVASGGHDFHLNIYVLRNLKPKEGPGVEGTILNPATQVPFNAFETMEPTTRTRVHQGDILALEFAPGGGNNDGCLLASASADRAIKVFSVSQTGSLSELWSYRGVLGHEGPVTNIVWGGGLCTGLLFSCGWDGNIIVWQGDAGGDGPQARFPRGHDAKIMALCVDADGKFIFSCSHDARVVMWSAQPPYLPLVTYESPWTDAGLNSLALTPSTIVSGSESGALSVWPLFNESEFGSTLCPKNLNVITTFHTRHVDMVFNELEKVVKERTQSVELEEKKFQ